MRLTLECPRARYGAGMMIVCMRDGELCAHQYYKPCKGWSVLSAGARRCPLREERNDEREKDSGRRD